MPAKPHRILTLSMSTDEIVLGLVKPDHMVAVNQMLDDPISSNVVSLAQQVETKVKNPSVEEIAALQPDLVIVPDWGDVTRVQSLRDLGLKVVVVANVMPASKWLGAMGSENVTLMLAVPQIYAVLSKEAKGLKQLYLRFWPFKNIRFCVSGAAPLTQEIKDRFEQKFNVPILEGYGLTETSPVVSVNTDELQKIKSVGPAIPAVSTIVVDDNGNEVPRNHEGELCVKGPGVMECYYKNDEASAESLPGDGWLRTGDVAVQDEDGFYYLVDRKKDVIVMGGENIYPVEIEDFLRGHEKINDVAVIGLPDKRLGEIPGAIIQLKQGMEATEEEIDEFCGGLARYKRPRKIIFAEVPRNATGKIEKPALRKKYGAEKLVAQEISMNTESL
jgi:long-chain acyl-CoA synthetase